MFFLPAIAFAVSVFILAGLLRHGEIDLGPKRVYIPVMVICGSIVAQVVYNPTLNGLANAFYGVYLFAIYLVARKYGQDLFRPFAYAVVVISLSIIIAGLINPGVRTGGLLSSSGNYDIAASVLILGTFVSAYKRQWILTGIVLVGLFFTGAEEGVFGLGVLTIYFLVTRDISRRILLPVGMLAITLAVATPVGITEDLYQSLMFRLSLVKEAAEASETVVAVAEYVPEPVKEVVFRILENKTTVSVQELGVREVLRKATGNRFMTHWTLSPIRPLGYGYNISAFYHGIPHNVLLIIIEQLGIPAALAWVYLIVYGIIKTRWRYAYVALFALGVWDHLIFTQMAPWWPAIIGASTASGQVNANLYRGELV